MRKGDSQPEQGRRKAQEENERRMKELHDEMERERQQALRDTIERGKVEHEEQRERLNRRDRERKERERKQKEEEKLLQLRLELLNYDFHKCPRIKKEAFQDLEIEDTDLIRIALIGPAGSGKTSLVGTLQRAIGEPQTAFEQGTGNEGSIILEEYYVQKSIRIVDTRGFFERDEKLQDEVLGIMTGRIRLGEEIKRDYDDPVEQPRVGNQDPNTVARKTPAFSKYIHAVIIVLKANDPRLEEGVYKETLQRIRDYFRTHGVYPVTVITFLDMLTAEERKKKASEAGLATGGPGGRTYFITNYTHENNEASFAVERTALDILDSALLSAESFIRIRKQRERNQMEREAVAGGASSGVVTVEQLFARLKRKYHWTDQGKTKAVLADLYRKDINTLSQTARETSFRMRKGDSQPEQGRRKAQEENERRMTELHDEMERERQQALRDKIERGKVEHEEQRERLNRRDRERKERERKQKEEEKLLQLRLELLNYDFHKCPRIKKEAFQDLEIEDTDLIRIALIGPAGSGKTSLVGTLQRAIGEPQTAFEQGTGNEGSIILEEYYVQKSIRIVDTRGFFERDEKLQDEVLGIMTGRIRLGEEIKRDYDDPVEQPRVGNQDPNTVARKTPAFSKYIHAVIIVLKANDPRLEEGVYKETLQRIRDYFRTHGVYPVTVITFLDMLTAEERKKKASEAGLATGGPGGRTYFITNYTHENNEASFAVERTALDILDSALLSAESFIRIRKQRERNQMEREAVAGGASSGVVTVEQFFARLKRKYHWTDQGKTKAVLADLYRKEINTVKALKELWDDVKSELPLSAGMEKIMEEEIKAII